MTNTVDELKMNDPTWLEEFLARQENTCKWFYHDTHVSNGWMRSDATYAAWSDCSKNCDTVYILQKENRSMINVSQFDVYKVHRSLRASLLTRRGTVRAAEYVVLDKNKQLHSVDGYESRRLENLALCEPNPENNKERAKRGGGKQASLTKRMQDNNPRPSVIKKRKDWASLSEEEIQLTTERNRAAKSAKKQIAREERDRIDLTLQTRLQTQSQDDGMKTRSFSRQCVCADTPANVRTAKFKNPKFRQFCSTMDADDGDCLIHALFCCLSTRITGVDVSSVRSFVFKQYHLGISGTCGFRKSEFQAHLNEAVNGHVKLQDCGDYTLTTFAVAIQKGTIAHGSYLCRATVKYVAECEHCFAVLVGETIVVRDPLKPGEHPFLLSYLHDTLKIISLSKVYAVKVLEGCALGGE
jgi:hypothetical protein